jgi:hypothetical protein
MAGDIPSGSQCDLEWTGVEAQLAEPGWIQDMRVACIFPDGELVRLRSLNLMLSNGTTVNAGIKYHADGTADANCDLSTNAVPLTRNLKGQADDYCVGPAYDNITTYAGPFNYGSAPVERYTVPNADNPLLNDTLDIDVQNGCIPVRVGRMSFNNYVLEEHQVLPEGTFDIPQECFQQSGRELPKWVRRSSFVQPFLPKGKRSTLVV